MESTGGRSVALGGGMEVVARVVSGRRGQESTKRGAAAEA